MNKIKIPPQIFFYGIVTIIIFWIVYLLMKRIGLIQDKAKKQAEKDIDKAVENITNSTVFDPNLYKKSNMGYAHLPSNQTVNDWAKEIHNSFGWFNDDEEQIYSVFRAMTSQLTVSQVSDAYAQLYSSDLFGDLRDYLNDSELAFVWKIIKSKPNV